MSKDVGRGSPGSRKAKIAIAAAVLVSALMILTKLFTTEAWNVDEPTVHLVVRSRPALTNHIRIHDDDELRGAYVLLVDENGFIGEPLYRAVTSIGWLIGCVVIAATAIYLVVARRRTGRPPHAREA